MPRAPSHALSLSEGSTAPARWTTEAPCPHAPRLHAHGLPVVMSNPGFTAANPAPNGCTAGRALEPRIVRPARPRFTCSPSGITASTSSRRAAGCRIIASFFCWRSRRRRRAELNNAFLVVCERSRRRGSGGFRLKRLRPQRPHEHLADVRGIARPAADPLGAQGGAQDAPTSCGRMLANCASSTLVNSARLTKRLQHLERGTPCCSAWVSNAS